ncbi:MAG: TonB-dependent receptor [Flavobacteriaceae bacterium]|nr:TonB-dependent receptor [Flavobacteriaceae bacterium]
MKKILFVFTIFIATNLYSQSVSFKITGTVKNEKEKTPLEAATIHLEKVKDSSVVTYTITNDKGNFSLEGKSFEKELRLYISFIGYKSFTKKITVNNKTIDLKTIYLKLEDNVLDEVVIKSRAPITIKKDTLEFNVKSFKTKKNASVEDLLKKLPGVEVDEEGKITINGKPVNKILVNGKPFFGNDPTIVTKNLTKDIIEKVQVTDTKTKSEAFTGQKGDKNNKTINLTIKKENNKGWFGRVAAGAGTGKHYEYAAIVNRFNNNRRFSVLAGGNNINSPGFSFGEIQKMFGNASEISISSGGAFTIDGRSFGGNQGIVKSRNTGVTYADAIGKKIDINGDYFHSGSTSDNKSTRSRENILPTGNYFSNVATTSNNDNNNHTINTEFDVKIDSTLLLNISPTFVFNNRESASTRLEETLDKNRALTNKSNSANTSKSSAKNFRNNLTLTKKIGKDGGFLKFRVNNQVDQSDSDSYNRSKIEIINSTTEDRNQQIKGNTDFTKFQTTFSYRQPLIAKKLFLNFDYTYQDDERESIKSTFDFNNTTNQFSDFNTLLSTDFKYNSIRKTPALGLTYRQKKWSASFKTGYVFRTIEGEDRLRPNLNLQRNFEAVELSGNFNYSFDSKASMYMGYYLNNSVPSINQLQPFTDETNPLNIVTGNPNLKPTDNHSLYVGYNKFNFQKKTGFFAYLNASTVINQVATNSTINPTTLVTNTTYENINGNYGINLSGNYNKSFKLDTVKSIRLRLGAYGSLRKNTNFFNGQKYSSNTNSISPNIGLTFNWKGMFEIYPRYTISFSETKFNISSFNTQQFIRHGLRIRTKTLNSKRFEWSNDIRYSYNPNISAGFNKSAWFWNATIDYSIFNDKGTISLKAYDLLNQNTNVRRITNSNYIEDSQSTVLQQYFMLSFSWKFNSLGKKGETRSMQFFEL